MEHISGTDIGNTMTVEDLHYAMSKLLRDGKGDYPICVAFLWRGDTVISDITTCDVNGKSIQLGEESFMCFADQWNLDNHHIRESVVTEEDREYLQKYLYRARHRGEEE